MTDSTEQQKAALTPVGMIGLGRMGSGMAQRLLAAGFALTVYDVNVSAASALLSAGAVWAGSPAEVGQA